MDLSDLICVDFESVELLEDGTTKASTEAYRHNFRVSSMATTEIVNGNFVSEYYEGEETCRSVLSSLQGRPLLSFNAQFEMLVSMCRFPGLELNWAYDSQRLAMNYDNGGDPLGFEVLLIDQELGTDDEDDALVQKLKKVSTSGFGLAKCVKRILKAPDHKLEAYTWLVANGVCKAGQEGAHLDKLPTDIMRRYNCGDTELTFALAQHCLAEFERIGYDWTIDHKLYMTSAKRLAVAKCEGIRVDREMLAASIATLKADASAVDTAFLTEMAEPIKLVARDLKLKRLKKFKTLRGAVKWRKRMAAKGWEKTCRFNPGSGQQLASLFCGKLGIEAFFKTDKGSPSMKAAHLYSYGEGGSLLTERKKILLVLQQCEKLDAKASYDGRWHIDLKACGTVTSRFAGAGGLNVQALARRSPFLMRCLIPDDDYIFVSQDASAGEPSILTQYTGDPMYRYFCFDGVGKRPYYDGDTLMIGDVYLAYASVCPLFKDEVRLIFNSWRHSNRTFAEQWTIDPEPCKDALKKVRKNAKWICLAFGYGLGPRGLYNKALEAGLKVTQRLCKDSHTAYWGLFSGIKAYCHQLEAHVESEGWFENPFGYRFAPTESRKAFNGMVQSSVSGLFNWYSDLLAAEFPQAIYIVTVHDENIYSCPKHLVDDFKTAQLRVADSINSQLNWSIKMRFGFVTGQNLYEAK